MSDRDKIEPKRCMTTLPPEMVAALPELSVLGLNVSDALLQGFVRVIKEVRSTGRLVLEPMPEKPAA